MKKKRGGITTVILLAVLFAGLSLLLYPSISNYWNSYHSSKAISSYSDAVSSIDSEEYDNMIKAATEYNASLYRSFGSYKLSDEERSRYKELLDISGTGIMGYIEIPSIDVRLPIYHGTDEAVLQVAVGHLEWSSLPVGGSGTHCVMSGHRGLPSAKLFTNLDKLAEGDIFMIRVLDEVFTYEVDRILIVDPTDMSALSTEYGKDLCTLVTCTPYGINTHRLLVRGHRIENTEEAVAVRIASEANQIEPLLVAPIVAIPLLFTALVILFIPKKKSTYEGGSDEIL